MVRFTKDRPQAPVTIATSSYISSTTGIQGGHQRRCQDASTSPRGTLPHTPKETKTPHARTHMCIHTRPNSLSFHTLLQAPTLTMTRKKRVREARDGLDKDKRVQPTSRVDPNPHRLDGFER